MIWLWTWRLALSTSTEPLSTQPCLLVLTVHMCLSEWPTSVFFCISSLWKCFTWKPFLPTLICWHSLCPQERGELLSKWLFQEAILGEACSFFFFFFGFLFVPCLWTEHKRKANANSISPNHASGILVLETTFLERNLKTEEYKEGRKWKTSPYNRFPEDFSPSPTQLHKPN